MSAFRTSSVLRMAARVPGIKFPTRRLPDGTRVSDLPAGTRWSTRALQISSENRENAKPTTSRSLTFSLPPPRPRRTSTRSRGEGVHGERGGGEWGARRENFDGIRRVSTETPAHPVSQAGSPPSDVEPVGDGNRDAWRSARLKCRVVAKCRHSVRSCMNAPPFEPGLGAPRGRADARNQTALCRSRLTRTRRRSSLRQSHSARVLRGSSLARQSALRGTASPPSTR